MVKVRVPASTANLGSGFDCMGIALNLYTQATFEETDSGVEIIINDSSSEFLPKDETNYVYKAMTRVFDKAGIYPKGVRITSHTDIPMTRGLGSSSAGVSSLSSRSTGLRTGISFSAGSFSALKI